MNHMPNLEICPLDAFVRKFSSQHWRPSHILTVPRKFVRIADAKLHSCVFAHQLETRRCRFCLVQCSRITPAWTAIVCHMARMDDGTSPRPPSSGSEMRYRSEITLFDGGFCMMVNATITYRAHVGGSGRVKSSSAHAEHDNVGNDEGNRVVNHEQKVILGHLSYQISIW